jgi:DNA-binding CsgD family transcriptional regulator/N-acetylneuraminic acid mutarotase
MEEEKGTLSERELEIMRLVATGATNRQIARELNISINTVKVHLRNVFEKLSVQSRTEATMYLVRAGLVTVDGTPLAASEGNSAIGGTAAANGVPLGATMGRRRRVLLAVAILVAGLALVTGVVYWNRSRVLRATPVTRATAPSPPPRWRPSAALPAPRYGMGVIAYQGKIYALGGYTVGADSAEQITGRSSVLDVAAGGWTELPDKPTPVGDVKAAVLEGRIFVPGGRLADGTITTTVEAFDPATAQWRTMRALPAPRSRYALVALEGKLILFGGWDGQAVQSTVLEYDADATQWTQLTPLPSPRADMADAVVEDEVYLLGGTDGQRPLSTAIVYHVNAEGSVAGPWDAIPDLPEPRKAAGAVAIARSIYVVGGGEGLPPIRYDLTTRTWGLVDTLVNSPWYDMGVSNVGNKLYVIGGRSNVPLQRSWEYTALYLYFLPQGAVSR